jgi:hypothetical protein
LSAVERVLKLAEINLGKKATKELGIDWSQTLPLVEIGASSHPAAMGRENGAALLHQFDALESLGLFP